MDRFFVDVQQINFDKKKCLITGEDVKHISKVLRAKVKDKIEICDKKCNEYICEILEINKDKVELLLLEKKEIKRESNVRVRLYQGLPKSTKMEIILQKLTEVGVDEIILVQNKRSVVKFENKKEEKKFERWERIIYEAAKQSKRGIIPSLRGVLNFNEALNDMKNNSFNVCPYEDEKSTVLKKILIDKSVEKVHTVGIFVGPEGGFDIEEIETLKKNDTYIVTLGPRILRTETASIVATSIVLYELSDLGGLIE